MGEEQERLRKGTAQGTRKGRLLKGTAGGTEKGTCERGPRCVLICDTQATLLCSVLCVCVCLGVVSVCVCMFHSISFRSVSFVLHSP